MKWTTLESKMLSAAAYDDSRQVLYLRFRNTGHVYRYFEFTAADQQAFLSAESKGRFFRSHIRDHFRYERMARLHAPDFLQSATSGYPPSVVETF
jgi:hypothetical protein